jgi:uncharacterized protein YggU (UPF0235/DUF167 family)
VLNWILIIELVLLAVLAVLGVIGTFIGKQDAEDPVYLFTSTFWREFLWPPEVSPIDSGRTVARDVGPTSRSRRGGAEEEPDEEDAFYGRVRKGADGKNLKAELIVIVIPNAASDTVLGRDGDGMKVQVTGEAGESRSNKALIEMVATALGIKPYQVTLTKGHYQTRKTVQIQGLAPDELRGRIESLAEAE